MQNTTKSLPQYKWRYSIICRDYQSIHCARREFVTLILLQIGGRGGNPVTSVGTLYWAQGNKLQWNLIRMTKIFNWKTKTNRIWNCRLRPFCSGLRVLTHRGRDKMVTMIQTTFSNALSWAKMHKFRLRCSKFVPNGSINDTPALCCFRMTDNGLRSARRQAIIWKIDVFFTDAYMRHSVSMS